MTYTVVYKDYPAETLEAAAADMLRDSEVWGREEGRRSFDPPPEAEVGVQKGYRVESWSWDGTRLRVWFR